MWEVCSSAYHVPSQDQLLVVTQLFLQLRLCKTPRKLLPDHCFSIFGFQLVELVRQLGAWSENGSAFGCLMQDVDDLAWRMVSFNFCVFFL